MLKAVLVVAEALEDPSSTVAIRAARATLETGLKANDLRDIQRRLDLRTR